MRWADCLEAAALEPESLCAASDLIEASQFLQIRMPLLDLLYLFPGLLELSPKTLLDIRQVAQLGFGRSTTSRCVSNAADFCVT